MPGVVIAPWLEEKPSDFVNAAKAGAQAGTELRGQDLEHQARMAAIAQQGADAQMRAQEEHERNQIQGDVAKSQLALRTQAAANLYQQQRQRQMAIDGGMDPIQAWLQFPGTTSGSPGAGVFQALRQTRAAALPLDPVPDPNNPGKVIGFHDGAKFYPLPQPRAAAKTSTALDPRDKVAIAYYQKQLNTAQSELAKTAGIDAPNKAAMARQALAAQKALAKYGVSFDGPAGSAQQPGGTPAPAPAQAGPSGPPPLPKVGEIQQGHRFLGGEAHDPNNWQPVGSQGSTFMGTPGQPNEAELPGDQQDNQPVPDETEEEQ